MPPKKGPAKPKPKKTSSSAPKQKLTGQQLIAKQVADENSRGIAVPFIFGLFTAAVVCVILLFMFQKGLPVTDRCNCSWERVIVYSVLACIACVLQLPSYLSYRAAKTNYEKATSPKLKQKFEKAQPFLIFGASILLGLAAIVVIFVAVPLLQDQNGNILWFFTKGGGILIILATLLLSVGGGIFDKIIFTQHLK